MNTPKADPWLKTTLSLDQNGSRLVFEVPHDVFSTQRIDEGTLLFLDHLPESPARSILDLGCGYGALGLPVAAQYPDSEVTLVDRDLLAVKWARKNASRNSLSNVTCTGSLGFEHLPAGKRFDWILCNVPARIGLPFIRHLLLEGNARLSPGGKLRLVVILDLLPLLGVVQSEEKLDLREVARGPKHAIVTLSKDGRPAPGAVPDLYLRDRVEIAGLSLDRPFDLGGDDPKRLRSALPLMIETLPREQAPEEVLCLRSAYGALPLLCRNRWPETRITVADRDLLALDYVRRNFEAASPGSSPTLIETPGILDLPDSLPPFDLILHELSPSIGREAAIAELFRLQKLLAPKGRVLVLSFERIAREWFGGGKKPLPPPLLRLAGREGFTVYQLTR
jgi:16S rRNA G1207 methylase RsmC